MMKNYFTLFFIILLSFSQFSLADSQEKTPAFPGAEGFGRYTTGGRGGIVYHVTSLADDGSVGTFRYAINQSGKRTIVFDISGTIHLTSPLSVRIGNVTIAGQTAPGDGICIADYPFSVGASNVIIRFIRVRLGNKNVTLDGADGWDGFGGMENQNIMIDHCSISWSIDEDCSFYGSYNITVQWCLVSQSLQDAGHSKGSHGYGGVWGGSGATYHHNLVCHHGSRTPRFGPRPLTQLDERLDYRNNVIYNWGGNGCYGGEGMNINIVNNYYKPGPATATRSTTIQERIASIGIRTKEYCISSISGTDTIWNSWKPALHKWGKYYVNGNVNTKYSAVTNDNWTYGMYNQIDNNGNDGLYTQTTKDTIKLSDPISYYYVTTHSAADAYDKVVKYAGASLSRDWVDTLMIYDTKNAVATYTGTSGKFIGDATNLPGLIDSQDDNKPANAGSDWSPWPTLNSTATPTDTDQDGMPDAWETANGLNPNDATDGNTKNSAGYTMLEVYMNSIVDSIMTNENTGGTPSGTIEKDNPTISETITLNQTTYTGSATTGNWSFSNGYSITNNNSKGYSTGSEQGVKYSKDVKFTINLPANIEVDSVKFSGYDNYSDPDAYLSELNGTTYTNTDYVYTKKDASGNYTLCSHTIPLSKPTTGSCTFTFGGNQVAATITLYVSATSGIKEKGQATILDPNGKTNVYGIDGRLIRANVTRSIATDGLQRGIYIIDKQKVIITK